MKVLFPVLVSIIIALICAPFSKRSARLYGVLFSLFFFFFFWGGGVGGWEGDMIYLAISVHSFHSYIYLPVSKLC